MEQDYNFSEESVLYEVADEVEVEMDDPPSNFGGSIRVTEVQQDADDSIRSEEFDIDDIHETVLACEKQKKKSMKEDLKDRFKDTQKGEMLRKAMNGDIIEKDKPKVWARPWEPT